MPLPGPSLMWTYEGLQLRLRQRQRAVCLSVTTGQLAQQYRGIVYVFGLGSTEFSGVRRAVLWCDFYLARTRARRPLSWP